MILNLDYLLWRLLYGLVVYLDFDVYFIFLVDPLFSVALVLLNWYFCMNGISFDVVLFMTKSSFLLSSDFSFASMAWMVVSVLSFFGSFDDVDAPPAANTGMSIFGLGFSMSSWEHNKRGILFYLVEMKDPINDLHNLCSWPIGRQPILCQFGGHLICPKLLLLPLPVRKENSYLQKSMYCVCRRPLMVLK